MADHLPCWMTGHHFFIEAAQWAPLAISRCYADLGYGRVIQFTFDENVALDACGRFVAGIMSREWTTAAYALFVFSTTSAMTFRPIASGHFSRSRSPNEDKAMKKSRFDRLFASLGEVRNHIATGHLDGRISTVEVERNDAGTIREQRNNADRPVRSRDDD